MKKYIFLFLICLCIYIFKSCTYVEKNYYITPEQIEYQGLDNEMFILINKHRKTKNLNELIGAQNLKLMAENHVVWMLNNEISHYGYTDRQLQSNAYSFGEIICTYRTSAYSYLMSYLNSNDGHKEIIEKNNITHIGIYTDTTSGLQCILVAGY